MNELIEFIIKFQPIVATIIGATITGFITVVGWIYVYKLNNKVQDRRVKNDITNTARKEIDNAIREYQSWLMKVITDLHDMMDGIRNSQKRLWLQKFDEHIRQNPNSWNETLDEHQILFPETANVRTKLQQRSIEIGQFLSDIKFDLLDDSPMFNQSSVDKKDKLEQYKFYLSYILNQFGLMEDIKIYLHNRCLSEITGNQVPKRNIKNESLPRIVIDSKGILDIKNNDMGISWLVQEIQKHS